MSETDIVENKGGKGNPYHEPAGSPEGGQFTSAPKTGEQEQGAKEKSKAFNMIMLGKKAKEAQGFFDKMPSVFDKKKTGEASAQEKIDLMAAYNYCQGKQEAINSAVEPYNTEPIVGAWQEPKYPSDYSYLKESGKFDAKLEYYENKYTKPDKEEWIDKMKKFQEAGEEFKKVYDSISTKYTDAEDMLAKFKPEIVDYSQVDYTERKKTATRLDFDNSDKERQECLKIYGPSAKKHIAEKSISNAEGVAKVKEYTGNPSNFNEPLRKTHYFPNDKYVGKKSIWAEKIRAMDDVIDSFEIDRDCFLRRGVSRLSVLNIGEAGKTITTTSNNSTEFLNSLIGTTFEDGAYMSCGTSENTGFGAKNDPDSYAIHMEVFVPKGAHALYVDGLSHFSGGHENETIIARGYKYKITNAYRKGYSGGGQIIIECELILNSNLDRPEGDALDMLAQQYHG